MRKLMILERARNHLACGLAKYASYHMGDYKYFVRTDGSFGRYVNGELSDNVYPFGNITSTWWFLTDKNRN